MLAIGNQRVEANNPTAKKDNFIKISYEQLSNLQSVYALQILKYIEKYHDMNCWSEIASKGFGYTFTSKFSFNSSKNTTPTFQNFVDLKKKEFVLDLQTEIDAGSSRKSILLQMVELIWFVYHSKVKITVDFDQLAKSVVSCMIINQDAILNEPQFKDLLHETFEMITWSRPSKDLGFCTTPTINGSLYSTISRLSNLFSRISLPSEITIALKQVFAKCHALQSPLLDTSQNIVNACKILLEVTSESDLLSSARWFRERGDQKAQQDLRQCGPTEYMKRNPKVDSVLMANYVKKLLKTIKLGLIPECIQVILNWLLQSRSVIPQIHIQCTQALLSISKDRFEVLKQIAAVGVKILRESKKEKITAPALASVIAVGEEKVLDPTLDQYQLRAEMERWQKTLGIIIANAPLFFSS